MNIKNMQRILDARENRARKQMELLFGGGILISYTLNIPGPVKHSLIYEYVFEEGRRRIEEKLSSCAAKRGLSISFCESENTAAGRQHWLKLVPSDMLYSGTEEEALFIKELMTDIEEKDALGRLFDIDVLYKNAPFGGGKQDAEHPEHILKELPVKMGRRDLGFPERKCLICTQNAFTCLRAARHGVPEVMMKVMDIILSSEAVCERIFKGLGTSGSLKEGGLEYAAYFTARTALRALLYEVITTPKPGLVDAENNGSHEDMDITVFFDSAAAIAPYFAEFFMKGAELCEYEPEDVLEIIRPVGIEAEERMFEATRGVNTHKGIIFSLGIICAAAGLLYGRETESFEGGKENGGEKDDEGNAKDICGAKLYGSFSCSRLLEYSGRIASSMKNGSKGIRKEAMNGYPSVKAALSRISAGELLSKEKENILGVRILIYIMSLTLDSNVMRRSSEKRAEEVMREAGDMAPMELPAKELIEKVMELDRKYTEENISPGGAADLLSATYFLMFLHNI